MPLRFTLRQLEYLVAVAECGSIALAADKVNVSSPSISAAIAQLEAEFGLPLFVRRHAHGLVPTQGGRRFVEKARTILAECAALNGLANDITGNVRGPLNLGCLVTFAQIVLPQLRRSFVDAHPEIVFRQFERDQSEIFHALRQAELDAALTYDLNIPNDLEFLDLVSLPPYVLLHDTHELSHRESVSVRDLEGFPMILIDLPMSADYFLSFFSSAGVTPNIVERTRDIAVARSLVANGFGYAILNIRDRSDLAPDGRKLRYVPLTGPIRPMRLGLLLVKGAAASINVRAFIEHCRKHVTPDSVPGIRLETQPPGRDG